MAETTEAAVRVVRKSDWGPELNLVPGGSCRPVIWPAMGARQRSLQFFELPDGVGTVPLQHAGEAVYYVVSGELEVTDLTAESSNRVLEGAMFHVSPTTKYMFTAVGMPATVIGGPSPTDLALYASVEPLDLTRTGGKE